MMIKMLFEGFGAIWSGLFSLVVTWTKMCRESGRYVGFYKTVIPLIGRCKSEGLFSPADLANLIPYSIQLCTGIKR